eukprot:1292526-Amphidinium_carterae.1
MAALMTNATPKARSKESFPSYRPSKPSSDTGIRKAPYQTCNRAAVGSYPPDWKRMSFVKMLAKLIKP